MTRLEDIKVGTTVRGIAAGGLARIAGVEWYDDQAIKAVYEDGGGTPNSRLIYRNEDLKEKMVGAPDYDLVVVDEAHKMSATYTCGESPQKLLQAAGEPI